MDTSSHRLHQSLAVHATAAATTTNGLATFHHGGAARGYALTLNLPRESLMIAKRRALRFARIARFLGVPSNEHYYVAMARAITEALPLM